MSEPAAWSATATPRLAPTEEIILASASAARANLLRAAGIACRAIPAGIDEEEIKRSMRAEGATVEDTALALAELKAQRIAARYPGILVIGADQMLELDDAWLDKPTDIAEARAHLKRLRGRRHRLIAAAVLLRDGARLWHHVSRAELAMRDFSDEFLERYLHAMREEACQSVGAYRLEGLGVQLFSEIEGDYFTILGLPLLPLLAALRDQSVLPA
jgi:septum formation protein